MGRRYVKFLCGHWSSRLPTSRRLATGTYAHPCAHCTRTDCQGRADDIKLRNAADKRQLRAIIEEKKKLRDNTYFLDNPRFQDQWQESTEAVLQLQQIEDGEPEEIRQAWRVYYDLWPSGWQ